MADRHLADRAIKHLKKEIGQKGLERYEIIGNTVDEHWKGYFDRYGEDISKWPRGEFERVQKETSGIIDTLTPPHLQKAFEQLDDLSVVDPNWPDAEQMVRKYGPDLVARMERGQVQPIEEPRVITKQPAQQYAPVTQPKPATIMPVRKTEVAPALPKQTRQKPVQVTPPRQRKPDNLEQRLAGFFSGLEKEGYWKMPTQADIDKQIAQERLRNMVYDQKQKEQEPVSLPEDINQTLD